MVQPTKPKAMTPTIEDVLRKYMLNDGRADIIYFEDAVKAMTEYASLNRQGCRWTKASERLPEIRRIYHINYHEDDSSIHPHLAWFQDGKFSWMKSNGQTTEFLTHKVYWLDESIEPCATSSDAIQFAEWLMENNYKWEIDGLVGYCWYEENESGESKLYAAADLYKIYKSQTPSPTGDRDCEELKKEVERLKGLIENQFRARRSFSESTEQENIKWQQFKTENNL